MQVGLALEIDISILSMGDIVTALDDRLTEYFREKDYGSGLAHLFIGVILTGPGSETLHPVRDLKFKKRVKYSQPPKVDLQNVAEYDVKPSFDIFSQLSGEQARDYLAKVLVDSLDILDTHKEKYPDFALARFKEDFRACLRT